MTKLPQCLLPKCRQRQPLSLPSMPYLPPQFSCCQRRTNTCGWWIALWANFHPNWPHQAWHWWFSKWRVEAIMGGPAQADLGCRLTKQPFLLCQVKASGESHSQQLWGWSRASHIWLREGSQAIRQWQDPQISRQFCAMCCLWADWVCFKGSDDGF